MDRYEAEPRFADRPEPPPLPRGLQQFRWSGYAESVFLFTGVVVPTVCLALGSPDKPAWQSGSLSDYSMLLLAHRQSLAFYPFLLYNMTCMTLMVLNPIRYSKHFVVRFGIYSGVILAIHYWVLFSLSLIPVTNPVDALVMPAILGAVAAFIWLIGWAIFKARPRFFNEHPWVVLALMVVVGLFPPVSYLCLVSATSWAVASYGTMSYRVATHFGQRRMRFTPATLLGVITWFAAYFAAWRTSIVLMLQQYTELPVTQPSGCYVSTAAVKGHRRLVRSEQVSARSGEMWQVNDQMRYLKAAELAWYHPHARRGLGAESLRTCPPKRWNAVTCWGAGGKNPASRSWLRIVHPSN